MTEDSMHRTLNAALARNSGPSAEDVEALASVLAALRYGSHTFTTHEMAERIAASDWLAAHTAAAKREGARAVVEAVLKTAKSEARLFPHDDGVAQVIAAAARAAARVEGGA